ncbi:hypothetical protein CWI75_09085 [Kineobactrum sediminis]|uniref:Uncharacterized protein n=1 Tax=Kineobactrum sediminis TaxID=1905677 RepID=A0A2N5Y2V4_9GAMM|nr:hypothetical protein [Kineobactrum sediminis]PLW82720.1 hypothetical protein CWI75_09085 [Kineobactrum sediminis]
MHYRNALTGLLLAVLLAACSAPQTVAPLAFDASAWPARVGAVDLQRLAQAPAETLDIALVSFDAGIPERSAGLSRQGIFPDIRQAEARFIPVRLRQVLQKSNAWGVVRVLPEPQLAPELQIEGRIVHSDGRYLVVHVKVLDASGRAWLDAVYADESSAADYPVAMDTDPFIDLYRQLANDLLATFRGLSSEEVLRIRRLALLRQASALAPQAFGRFLQRDENGNYQLQGLPAEGDPMLARVQRIRNQEHLFIDTVDEQYVDLFQAMQPTYNLWRQYGREQALYRADYQRRLAQRDSAGARGSYAAMEQSYNAYRWSKIQQQDLEELARGFNNEVQPTVLDVSGSVVRLSGSLESQYDEWRRLLQAIFALESGLPGTPP